MSAIVQTIACPACQNVADFTAYESINVGEHPALLPALLRNELFTHTCRHCGQITPVAYDTLFHDPQRKLMVWLIQDENEAAPQAPRIAAQEDYILRRVYSPEELIEKAQLARDGIDDRSMELFKLVVGRTLMKQNPDTLGMLNYAGRIESDPPGLAFRITTAENVSAMAVDMKEFTHYAELHEFPRQAAGEWAVINHVWAMRQIRRP